MRISLLITLLLSMFTTGVYAQYPGRQYSVYDRNGIYTGYYRVNPYNGNVTQFNRYNHYQGRLQPTIPTRYGIYDSFGRYQGSFQAPKISSSQYQAYKAELRQQYKERHGQ